MLKKSRIILSVILIGFAAYVLITNNFEFITYMLLVMGVLGLLTGVAELQEKRKTSAVISILAGAFVFFVAIYIF